LKFIDKFPNVTRRHPAIGLTKTDYIFFSRSGNRGGEIGGRNAEIRMSLRAPAIDQVELIGAPGYDVQKFCGAIGHEEARRSIKMRVLYWQRTFVTQAVRLQRKRTAQRYTFVDEGSASFLPKH
jgi:hypothetical protein